MHEDDNRPISITLELARALYNMGEQERLLQTKDYERREDMDVITKLRILNTDRMDLDDMVATHAVGKLIRSNYESEGLVTPEWLDNAITLLGREIAEKRHASLLAEAKKLEAEEKTLLTREEKRASLNARKAEIDKLLGRTPVETK